MPIESTYLNVIPYYTTNNHNENRMKWSKKIIDVQFSSDDPRYFVIRKFSIRTFIGSMSTFDNLVHSQKTKKRTIEKEA